MTQRNTSLRVAVAILALACAGIAAGQSGRIDLEKAPRLPAGAPVTFGTTQETFVTLGISGFEPGASDQTFDFVGPFTFQRYSTGGGTGFFAEAQLPDGAVLTSVTFDLCDSNAADLHMTAALASCTSVDGACAVLGAPLVSTSNVGIPCAAYTQDVSGLNYVVDNQSKRLYAVVVPGENDPTNAFAGAVLSYKLQVSPAPAVATFGDVPTGHPFFQFVEALAKSGITGGCGGGNYCPENPVTRGQMAVFLAKALGLQFP